MFGGRERHDKNCISVCPQETTLYGKEGSVLKDREQNQQVTIELEVQDQKGLLQASSSSHGLGGSDSDAGVKGMTF